MNSPRKRAEGALPPERASEEPLSPGDAARLIYELRLHRTELETQNEELRQTQEALEAGRAKFFGFYNLAPVGFFTMNGEGLVFETNLTTARLLATERSLLGGQPFTRFVTAEHQDAFYLFLKKLVTTGQPQSCEVKMARHDGTLFWGGLDATVAEGAEDGAPPYHVVIVDITDRKAAEEKLKAAKEIAEAATQLKDKFVSLVAHDLRSPLATVILLQKVTMSSHKNSTCDECKTTLGISVGICETMLGMADNILESAQLQTGVIRLNRKICDMRNVCEAAMGDLRYLADKKELVLKNEVPHGAKLYVDRVLFQRIIHNLVSNAIKFSNKGGTIAVSLADGQNVIAVKDTGVGIGEGVLGDLFKYEVKTSTTGTSGERGTGFGLPLSMEIAKAHGGTIRVTSQKGEGSVFYVEAPDVKPLVLVAEDDESSALTLRRYLENMGAEVLEAKNGAEALEIVHGRNPALVITDLTIPVMDGLALLQNLKTDAKYSLMPVIVITGTQANYIEMRKKAFEYRADDFITKPLSEPDFIPRIGRFIAG